MYVFRPDEATEYRQQAEKIRNLAAQISILEAKLHLLEAAEQLEGLAADEGGEYGATHDPFIPIHEMHGSIGPIGL
jgi:hypothetical protein